MVSYGFALLLVAMSLDAIVVGVLSEVGGDDT